MVNLLKKEIDKKHSKLENVVIYIYGLFLKNDKIAM